MNASPPAGRPRSPSPATISRRCYATLLWLLTCLFAARVLLQALQWLHPVSFLPPFSAFQGSDLPYWLLLPSQLLIIGVMLFVCRKVQRGLLRPDRRIGTVLAWCGGTYMAASIGRLVTGWTVPSAAAWFSAWIPALLHLVLAGFVLTLSAYHRRESHSRGQMQQ